MLEESSIIQIPLDNLVPNKINPKSMTELQFKKLKKSIEQLGLLNPIIVRKLSETKYEIIDGEHRYKAFKELGHIKILSNVIKATDEDVKKIILTSTIKGNHNFSKMSNLVDSMGEQDNNSMLVCNIDKRKNKRIKGYKKYSETESLKDESECAKVFPIDTFKKILFFSFLKDEYDLVINFLNKINKDNSKALLKLAQKNVL